MSQAGSNSSISVYPGSPGTAGQVLQSTGTSTQWTTATYPSTTTANQILYSSANNTISELTSTAKSVLLTNGSSVPAFSTTLDNSFTYTTSSAGNSRVVTATNTDNTNSNSSASFAASVGGTSAGDPYFKASAGSARSYAVGIDNSDSQSFSIATAASASVTPSDTKLVRVSSAGNRTMPLNSCVNADLTVAITNATGDGTNISPVIFNSELFDQNSNYNPATGLFTAPVAGKYLVTAFVTFSNLSAGHTSGELTIIASGANYKSVFNPAAIRDSADLYTATITRIVNVAASGTIQLDAKVSGSTKTVGIQENAFNQFSGMCINLIS